MLETDPAIIDAQITALVDARGANIVLCNFASRLPGEYMRPLVATLNRLDEPMVDSADTAWAGFRSPRAQAVTWNTFFSDVDKALEATGIVPEIFSERKKSVDTCDDVAHDALYRTLLPAYKYLRMMGYSHHDLII